MALVWKDRVLETTTTTGTGTLTLAGAVTGYQTFAAIGDGNTAYYCIYAVDGFGNPSGVWEVGLGTYTASGTTLARTTVYANSSGTQVALDLAAGPKRVMSQAAAQHLTTIPVVNGGTGLTALGSALQVLRTNAGATAAEWATISTGLTVGTTAIASGTSGRLLYDAAGTLGETAAVTYSTSTPNLTVTASGAAVVPLVVKGATSQTANLTEWQDSTGAVVASFSASAASLVVPASFSLGSGNTNTGTQSMVLGVSSAVAGTNNYALGTTAAISSSGSGNLAFGTGANVSGSGNNGFAVNNSAVSASNAIGIGTSNTVSADSAVAVGNSNVASAIRAVAIGTYAEATVAGQLAHGAIDNNPIFTQQRWSSTNTTRNLFQVTSSWADSTDATRKGRAVLQIHDTAARECVRLEASGSAAMLGLYGTAATVQYATTGTVTGYTGGGGTALTHSDTFTGNTGATAYTIGDIVRALKLLGVIAA